MAAKVIRIKKKTEDTPSSYGNSQGTAKRIVIKKTGASSTASAQSTAAPKRIVIKKAGDSGTSGVKSTAVPKKIVIKKSSSSSQPSAQNTAVPKKIVIKKASPSSKSGSGSSGDSGYYGGGVAALRAARQGYYDYDDGYDGGNSSSYLSAQNALIDAQLEAVLSQISSARTAVSQQSDDAARQAYVNLRSSENALPQKLSAAGQSGGMAQSAMLDLYTNYERSRNDIQRDRINQLAEIDNTMAQARANGGIQKAQAALDYQKQQAQQQYQRELLRLKAAQQQALSRQQHLQEMEQISARNSWQGRSLEDEAEEELVLSEAFESLSASGDIGQWRREYEGILSGSQINQLVRQFQG